MRFALLALLAACRIGFDPVDGADASTGASATCPPDEDCNVNALPGLPALTLCTPGQVCTVNCRAASSCHVDCTGARTCVVSCPASNCDVIGCAPHSCFVSCGSTGISTQTGTTASCP